MDTCEPRDDGPSIPEYLTTYGWHFKAGGPDRWTTGWQGEHRFFALSITSQGTVIRLACPLIRLPVVLRRGDLALRLLMLNHELTLVRLALGSDDGIDLLAETPRDTLTYAQFDHLLGVLGYYADELSQMLVEMIGASVASPPQGLLC